jgi:hypothetical protein
MPQALPSQVASALADTGHGLHAVAAAVPQLFTSLLSTQLPLQSCLPAECQSQVTLELHFPTSLWNEPAHPS